MTFPRLSRPCFLGLLDSPQHHVSYVVALCAADGCVCEGRLVRHAPVQDVCDTTQTDCSESPRRSGSNLHRSAAAAPVTLPERQRASCSPLPAPRSSRSRLSNLMVKDAQRQARGTALLQHCFAQQPGSCTGARQMAVQQAKPTDGDAEGHRCQVACNGSSAAGKSYEAGVADCDVSNDSPVNGAAPPHSGLHRGRNRNKTLRASPDNCQHQMMAQQKEDISCSSSSPKFSASPGSRCHQPVGHVLNKDDGNDCMLSTSHDSAPSCELRSPEANARACCANNTVDAVRNIYWELESFMEQYLATQSREPDEPQQTSLQHSVHPSPATNQWTQGCFHGVVPPLVEEGQNFTAMDNPTCNECISGGHGAAQPHSLDHSNMVRLSITSKPRQQDKRTFEQQVLPSAEKGIGKTRSHEGLHAMVSLWSGTSAEISVFNRDQENRLSTVFLNSTRGKPDFDQGSAAQSQGVAKKEHWSQLPCD
jgi:hypothetical protein